MKKLLFLPLFICCLAHGQKIDKDLWSLVEAEKAFSKMAGEKNTRDAFVYFFAPNSVLVEGGKEVNGAEFIKQWKVDSSYIVWEPNFADISSSKDFGYTTGPAKFYKTKFDSVLLGTNYYASMWEKQPNGEWKVIFDLGSAISEDVPPSLTFSINPLSYKTNKISKEQALNDVLKIDKEYVAKLNAKNVTVESSYFSEEGRVHRPRIIPVKVLAAINAYTEPPGRTYIFGHLNGRVANSGDLAFTYGTLAVTIPVPNASPRNVNARYFRVWKKEGNTWKIVLDVNG